MVPLHSADDSSVNLVQDEVAFDIGHVDLIVVPNDLVDFVGYLVTTLKLGILLELAADRGVNSLEEIEILLVSHYANLVGLGLN